MSGFKTTNIVNKVPTKYRDGRLRYWCNHCKDSHDTRSAMDRHYREHHEEHLEAEIDTWTKQSYAQTRHSGNESDCEDGTEFENTYDEQSDESESEDENEGEGQPMRNTGRVPAAGGVAVASDEVSSNDPSSARSCKLTLESQESESEDTDESAPKHFPGAEPMSAEKVRYYFEQAAHGNLTGGVKITDLTKRGIKEFAKMNQEEDGRQVNEAQDDSDAEDEDETGGNGRSNRGRRRTRGALQRKKGKKTRHTHC